MSSVLEITIETPAGSTIQAVLKLYDRRFGVDLRDVRRKHLPHTAASEAAYQSFIRQGLMAPFIGELEEEEKTDILPSGPWHYLDDDTEGIAKFEAALWRECNKHLHSDTQAYAHLKALQGTSIPKLLAHVRLVLPPDSVLADLSTASILLERINGYNLDDICTPLYDSEESSWTELSYNPEELTVIVQSAAEIAHEINKSGVMMHDCAPRNVVVARHSQAPYLIDFAQCASKEDMVKTWYEREWDDDEDWDPDVEYWEQAQSHGNPGAIGAVMAMRLKRRRNMELDVRYPDYAMIIEDVKRCKLEAAGEGGVSKS